MLKVPTVDISIESPKLNEFVNIVLNKNDHILGRGSYGRVYKAVYKGKSVAVKIIEKTNEKISNSVHQESNILGWSHENIISVFKITSLPNCFTIIMERFPGICLQHLLDEMKIPLYHRIRISIDVITGLRFCHSNDLVHLDVKPQNILVAFTGSNSVNSSTNDYICKIFDFGCSVFIDRNSHHSYQQGTIRYMSPNRLQGNDVGLHDDIYSFGITIWQLKTNKHPYHKITSNEVVAYHVVKNKVRPDLPTKFVETDENTLPSVNLNSKIDSSTSLCGKCSLPDGSSNHSLVANHKTYRLLTPNFTRKPLVTKFLSAGHLKKHSTLRTSLSKNVIKRLDFEAVKLSDKDRSLFTSYSVNRNTPRKIPEVPRKIRLENETNDPHGTANLSNIFNESCPSLSKERITQIETEYTRIYKMCWEQDASMRPSSEVVLNLLSLVLDLFD